MSRSDLVRHLRAHGAAPVREGGRHEIWGKGDATSAVPRHSPVKKNTALKICQDLGIPKPKSF